jgi:hypothetical protein
VLVKPSENIFGAANRCSEMGFRSEVVGEGIRSLEDFGSRIVGGHNRDCCGMCHVMWCGFGLPADVTGKGEGTNCAALGISVSSDTRIFNAYAF